MRKSAEILTLVSVLTIGLAGPGGAEVTVTVTDINKAPDIHIEGQVTVKADDVHVLQGTSAQIDGNTVNIVMTKPGSTEPTRVLSGVIIKSMVTPVNFKGYVVFQGGPGLVEIDDPDVEEMIEIQGGQLVSGHIAQVDQRTVKIGNRELPMSQISRLCSPRIFMIDCMLAAKTGLPTDTYEGNAASMKFTPTTSLPKDGQVAKAGDSQKRCCQLPPLVMPPLSKKKSGHVHIVIPLP